MEPEQYTIRVTCALTGVHLTSFCAPDLALASIVYNQTSSALLLATFRFSLLYEGKLVDNKGECNVMSRFRFNRVPTLQCVFVEPTHCSTCLSVRADSRCYYFERANGPFNYALRRVERRTPLGECYCHALMLEFGWKCFRNWVRFTDKLLQCIPISKRISSARASAAAGGRSVGGGSSCSGRKRIPKNEN